MILNVQLIPTSQIRVLNARSRSKVKFREIVENIGKVGLKKPITVCRREGEDGGYDLVCGQGRLEAYQAHGATEIPAIIIDATLEERLLRSLVENLTRRSPTGVQMAQELVALKHRGYSPAEIALMVGVSETYVKSLLRLAEKGEERLVAAVERGEIPISAAIDIASSDDATLQRSLQTAYESGELRGKALLKVRRLIDERKARGKEFVRGGKGKGPTAEDLVRTLRRETQKQKLLIKKARVCEQQLRFVVSAFKELMKDENFVTLLRAEKVDAMPKYLSEMIQK